MLKFHIATNVVAVSMRIAYVVQIWDHDIF
jgi:hypothetical protein